jgi:hypothetical protein
MENNTTELPLKETYHRKISPVDLCVIYSMIIKRIAKGYSASEVSFLMGYENGAIEKLEQLNFKELTIGELHNYTNVLGDDAFRGIIMSDMDEKQDIDYHIVKTTERAIIHHEVFTILPDNSSRQIFNLFEVNPEYEKLKYSTSYETGIKDTKEILNSLLEGALFQSPERPFDIYERCRRISTSIRPYYVQVVLNDMAQSKDYPKFKRTKTKKYGYLYEKAF